MLQLDCARSDRQTHDAERPREFTRNIKVSPDDNRTANEVPMMAGRDSLLKSDDEEELVFDQTGLLTNKLSSRHGVLSRTLLVNSGGRLTIARTVNLCLSFFGLGLCFAIPTATIQDLQRRTNSETSIEHIYTARYGGYIFGCLIGGFLFDWYNRQFLLFLSIFATSIGIVVMPFCAQLSTLMACSAITGITMGFLDTGGNVWCLDLWGRHSAPFMQGLHFCFALGALVAPLIAEPFLSPNALGGVTLPQHTQPLHPGNSSLLVDNFGHIPSIGIHHGIVMNRPLPHQLVSDPAPGFLQRDRPRRRRRNAEQTTPPSSSSAATNVTKHPIHNSTQQRVTTLPSATFSSVPTSSSVASTTTSIRPSSPAPTTGNNVSTSGTGVNDTDLVQSRMDSDNTTTLQTSASVDVTTAVKKPTKPLYAEGAAAKSKWDRESQKPILPQPVPVPKLNVTATSNSSMSKNATANGNMSTTAPSSGSVLAPVAPLSTTASTSSTVSSSVAPSSTPAPSSGSVLVPVAPFLTTDPTSSTVSSSVAPSSTPALNSSSVSSSAHSSAVSSSTAAKPSAAESSKTSTQPSASESQTPSPSSGDMVTAPTTVPTNVAGLYNNTTMPSTTMLPGNPDLNPTTQSDHARETVLPTNVASTTVEPMTTTTKIDTKAPSTPSSSATAVPKIPSAPTTTKTSEETLTATAGPMSTVTDAATITTKRSSETFPTTEPDIPKVHYEKSEVQTVPSTPKRPSVLTHTTTAATVITGPFPKATVDIPTSRLEIASNVNTTETNGIALEPNGTLQKTPVGNPTQATGLTSWILDKFKQNRLGKLEVVYAILGTYLFVVSAVFLVFLCTNPRETRSRQEEDIKVQGPSSKWSLVLLSSLFFFLYMGMEAAVGELLRIYAAPQTPGAPLPRGYLLTYVFWGSFAAARGIAVVAAIKVSCRTMLLGDLGVCFLASVLLVVGADRMDALLWAGVGVLGVGMASVLPTSLAWLERHVRVTNRIASVVLLGAAMGEMVLPFLASHFVDREPAVVVYVNVTVVTLCCLNFAVLWLAAAKRGEKYAAAEPDRSLYQLANLDDVDESADFTLLRPLCANGDDRHALLVTGKPRARFLRDPDVAAS